MPSKAVAGPLRQVSLDLLTAATLANDTDVELERHSIFQDVLEQLAGRQEASVSRTTSGLMPLPSLHFLEGLLDDLDREGVNAGELPAEPPLYLPLESFDLVDRGAGGAEGPLLHYPAQPYGLGGQSLDGHCIARSPLGGMQSPRTYIPVPGGQHWGTGVVSPRAAGAVPQPAAGMPAGAGPCSLRDASSGGGGWLPGPRRGRDPVAPSRLCRTGARAVGSCAETDPYLVDDPSAGDEWAEPSSVLVTSKAGRVRRVASFAGVKRSASDAELDEGVSALGGAMAGAGGEPRPAGGMVPMQQQPPATQQQRGGGGSWGVPTPSNSPQRRIASVTIRLQPAGEERAPMGAAVLQEGAVDVKPIVHAPPPPARTKGRSGRKSQRTTCLNCGCHSTPQWRCGPLGPRTLCNACGVRFKKGLPLNCWPLRDGMVLPPGATLPSELEVPEGMRIYCEVTREDGSTSLVAV